MHANGHSSAPSTMSSRAIPPAPAPVEALFEPSPTTPQTPTVQDDMSFATMCEALKLYFVEHIESPLTQESLRVSPITIKLTVYLSERTHNPAIVGALLWCRAQFAAGYEDDFRGIERSRAAACEIVAAGVVASLSAPDALQYLCYELDLPGGQRRNEEDHEEAWLLGRYRRRQPSVEPDSEAETGSEYTGLNTLEIAVMAEAKSFMANRAVQKVIHGIWSGNISFWKTMDVDAQKKPHFYNKRTADPFCRLRVPRYQKIFEAIFFFLLLVLYYAVLIERNPDRVDWTESALIVFFTAFAVDELSSIRDSTVSFYLADVWSYFDLLTIIIGVCFLVFRIIGIVTQDPKITDTAFDVLSVEAIVLVPRVFSLLALHPYFGMPYAIIYGVTERVPVSESSRLPTKICVIRMPLHQGLGVLIPCLKQMTKDFLKFLVLVVVLYLGFLTTFSLLSRDRMTFSQVSWMLINVFFGSSYVGFEAMRKISPYLGPPLMLIFVVLTNILLVTSLISLLSISLTNMMNNAREEYLFMFSIMVLEASTSARRVVFIPPMNLLPLVLLRPLRLIFPARKIRRWRVVLLKICHGPIVLTIMAFERLRREGGSRRTAWGPTSGTHSSEPRLGLGLRSVGRLSVGAGVGAGGEIRALPNPSTAASPRLDDPGLPSLNTSRLSPEEIEDLGELRTAVGEMARKLDELLAKHRD